MLSTLSDKPWIHIFFDAGDNFSMPPANRQVIAISKPTLQKKSAHEAQR
jgi:hypothetical protein